MSPRPALAPPRDLTIPDPGSFTAREVLSRALGRLLVELAPSIRAHASKGNADAFLRVLASLDRDGRGALAASLRHPQAGTLVRVLRDAARGERADLGNELVAILAFDLWAGLAFRQTFVLRDLPARIVSGGRRIVLDLQGVREMELEPGRLTLRGDGAPAVLDATMVHPRITRPFVPLEGEIVLALADNNPLAMVEAHPEKSGNCLSLGDGHAEDEWLAALRGSFAIVAEHLPALHREMGLVLQEIVPVGFDAERHESASYREAIGAVYMTLHPNLMTMTEALVHEFQHNKLNALFEIDDVLTNAYEPLYPSPVRPDPRPLHGVLLALHAFLPVARLYERMLAAKDPRAKNGTSRLLAIVQMNREAASVVLANARPTDVGRGLLDELARWNASFGERASGAR